VLTLKIKWMRYEKADPSKEHSLIGTADETTLFIECDEVRVHGVIISMDAMKAWDSGDYMDYAVREVDSPEIHESRLIEVIRSEKSSWYLASHAWILGSNGQTIERVA
jgi:hypothetical protein